MDNIQGRFTVEKDRVVLSVPIRNNKSLYHRIKRHIGGSMFLKYKRPAPKFKKVVLHSVGDRINEETGQQNYLECDLYLDITVRPPVSVKNMKVLEGDRLWHIKIKQMKGREILETICFSINKDSEEIVDGKVLR